MAYYWPEAHRRQAELVPATAALLFIDIQAYNCSKEGAIYQSLSQEQQEVSHFLLLLLLCRNQNAPASAASLQLRSC